jgi:hypothetical protein
MSEKRVLGLASRQHSNAIVSQLVAGLSKETVSLEERLLDQNFSSRDLDVDRIIV